MLARTRALGLFCAFAGLLVSATAGCSSSRDSAARIGDAGVQDRNSHTSSTQNDEDEQDAASSSNPDAGATEQDAGNPCNVADDPDDDFADTNCDGIDGDKNQAVFVSLSGTDSADGSWGHSVATLKRGIELAIAKGKDVYACKGDYKENITINAQGVRVFGGYDCAREWERNSISQARIASPSALALIVTNCKQPVILDRVDVESSAAVNPGDSSVAIFIASSSQVTLRRGTFLAHDGATAEQPVVADTTPASSVVPLQGTNAEKRYYCGLSLDSQPSCADVRGTYTLATDTNGALELQTIMCSTGDLTYGGGGGGTDVRNCYSGTPGAAGYPPSTSGTLDGTHGRDGMTPTVIIAGYGTLTSAGYIASNSGAAGQAGTVGEGGTGGRGGGIFESGFSCDVCTSFEPRPIAGGGQGGPGGCGGLGGAAGNAGGASIAVAVYQSNVTIERAVLQTGKGGAGSAGGLGAKGAKGTAGAAAGMVNACGTLITDASYTGIAQSGGKGGDGGDGSQGGPGGGGPSIPLFVSGTTPTVSAVTFLPGSGGPGGSNGGSRATDGDSVDQKVIP